MLKITVLHVGTRANFYNAHLQDVNFFAETKKKYQTDLIYFFFVAAANFAIKNCFVKKKSTHGNTRIKYAIATIFHFCCDCIKNFLLSP